VKTLKAMQDEHGKDLPDTIEIREPFKYWNPDKYDVFEPNKLYKSFHDYEFEQDFCMLAYEV
jgi:hypothetical protein